jgi:hypothetical protein
MSRLTTPLSVLAVAGISITLAACGSSSNADSTSSAAGKGQSQSPNRTAQFEKFRQCIEDKGVTLPDRGQRPDGNGGGRFSNDPKLQAAMKACAKYQPQGRGGPGGTDRPQQNIEAFTPYLTCLKHEGLDIKVSDGFNALRNLKRDDPKVQAALKSCQPKIPQPPTAPQGTSATTTS